jgi:hypothetical protein
MLHSPTLASTEYTIHSYYIVHFLSTTSLCRVTQRATTLSRMRRSPPKGHRRG